MNIRKTCCALLVCALSAVCCACGSDNGSSETMSKTETTASVPAASSTAELTTILSPTTVTAVTTLPEPTTCITTVVVTERPKTEKDILYEEYYDYLIGVGEGTGFFCDFDGDGYEDMIIGEPTGIHIITRNTIDNEFGYFGFQTVIASPEYYIVTGSDVTKYLCCDSKRDNKMTKIYCNLFSDKEIDVDIVYDNGSAKWDISDPSDWLSFLADGKDEVGTVYEVPQNCWDAINRVLPENTFSISSGSSYERMDSLSFNQMKQHLLDLLGRSSSMMNDQDPNEGVIGEGTVHTDGGKLNVRKSPSAESEIVTQLVNGSKIYVLDDSYAGWLLVNGFDADYHIFYGYVSDEFVNWSVVN